MIIMRVHFFFSIMGAVLFAWVAAPAFGTTLVQSTFDADVEGWFTVTIAPSFPTSNITWVSTGGTPGGAIRHDAPSDGWTSYFVNTSQFPTALHSALGGKLSWDVAVLFSSGDTFYSFVDVSILAGPAVGGDRIRISVTSLPPATHPGYSHYEVAFDVSEGWSFFDGGTNTTTPATQADIDAILSAASALSIRGEYFSSETPDVAFLDNVMVLAVPEPGTLLLLGSGLVGVSAGAWRRRRSRP